MKIEKVLIKQEQLVCRAEKNTKLLLCMLLIFPLDLIGVPFQYRLINAFTTGNVVSHTGVDLAISATIFLFGWSLPLLVIMMYISTELIITNKRVFIRNGISGTLTIIPLDSIAGIENCDTVSSFLSLYYLSVHLLDGKKICSATCFSKNGLKDVEKALADKSINKFDFFKMKYGRYRKPMIDEVLYHKYSTNHLLPITAITLFIIPVIMYVMWFIKFS